MDYNNYILFTLMPLGRYSYENKRVYISRTRTIINRILIAINIICGLKIALILLIPNNDAVLYFIELYIANGIAQKVKIK